MSVVSARQLCRWIASGYCPEGVGPASLDLRISDQFLRQTVDASGGGSWHLSNAPKGVNIYPGEFLLASTVETIHVPTNAIAHITGRSSVGRLGITVHITAALIKPGFKGQITLEVVNHSCVPVKLVPYTRICQIYANWLESPVSSPYGEASNSYQQQTGPQPSKGLGLPSYESIILE